MPLSTEDKRVILRKLYADSVMGSVSLSSILNSAAFGTVTQTLSGKVLIEARAKGSSARYELSTSAGANRPQDVSACLSQLLDLYDDAAAALGTTTDALMYAWMLAQIAVIRSYAPDFTSTDLRT